MWLFWSRRRHDVCNTSHMSDGIRYKNFSWHQSHHHDSCRTTWSCCSFQRSRHYRLEHLYYMCSLCSSRSKNCCSFCKPYFSKASQHYNRGCISDFMRKPHSCRIYHLIFAIKHMYSDELSDSSNCILYTAKTLYVYNKILIQTP